MQSKDFIPQIQGLIAKGETERALKKLQNALHTSPKLMEVLQQSGRYHTITKKILTGQVAVHDATVIENQIRFGLLELLEQLQDEQPEIRAELAQAAIHIEQSKNVSTGNNEAGRDIHIGDKSEVNHHYGDKVIKHALTAPPFDPPYFIGRDKDLKKLRKKLLNDDNILLLVNGKGGMGKTSLASRYYRAYAQEYAHVAWVLSEQSIANALLLLALPLGLDFRGTTYSKAQRLDRVIHALADLERPCLLIIDNVNEVDDLRQHFQALRRCNNFHLLLTTRINNFSEAELFKVEGLKEKHALKLFKKHYPEHDSAEDDLLKKLIVAVDNNTLLLELFAKNLYAINEYEEAYSLQALLDDVQQNLLSLRQSQAIDTAYQTKGMGLRHETPEAIVAAMYDVHELSEAERKMISIFAVLPNEDIPFQDLKCLLSDTDIKTPAHLLVQKGWIDFNRQSKAFKANQVVQDVVKVKHKARLLEDCGDLITALANELDREEILHKDSYATALRFAQYAESIVAALDTPDFEVGRLYQNIGNFHTKTGDLIRALEAYEKYSTYFDKLATNSPDEPSFKNGLASSYSKLGKVHSALGNLDKALDFFEQFTSFMKALYEAYPQNVDFKNGLAISYEKLGATHSALGNLDKALDFFEQYNQLEITLYEAYPQNVEFKNVLAISYEKLGTTHSALGNLGKALDFFEQYNQLEIALYEAYPQNVDFKNGLAISYEKLGATHSLLGNLDKALNFFEQYNQLGIALYEAYPQNVDFKNSLAISYGRLGATHSALGNLDKALIFFEQRSHLVKALYEAYSQNVDFKNGLAISYERLGATHSALGNLDKALIFFEQRSHLVKALYEAYPQNVDFKNGLALSFQFLGNTHSSLGNLDKALSFFEQYNQLEIELYEVYPQNIKFKNLCAISYQYLGVTHSMLGNLDKALDFFKQYNQLKKELYESYPQNVGFKNGLAVSYYKLSHIHLQLDNKDLYKNYLQQAAQLWENLVKKAPQYVDFQRFLDIVQEELSTCP